MSDKLEDAVIQAWKLAGSVSWMPGQSLSDFVRDSQDHVEAAAFLHEDPKEGVDYAWVLEFGKTLWDHRIKVFSLIDEKADSIIKYLGGGTGIFALGIIAKVDPNNAYLIPWCLPAIAVSLLSIFHATLARRAREAPSPPTVAQAVREYANAYEKPDDAKAAFLGQWNLACVDMKLVCHRKAFFLERATWLYFFALLLLALPLLVAVFCPPAKNP